jgi:hypothetical protein
VISEAALYSIRAEGETIFEMLDDNLKLVVCAGCETSAAYSKSRERPDQPRG